ncbi:hypothetical protein SIM91_42695 [Rhodococcus opacus]|nr:hypothetical protein [Rhodococcus opacus]MDX5969889.1 hypothetical protein [Rhodococcus opacus]CAG7631355.1 hypothetical protein E143388_07288 [Rhodococcus opacus]
MLFLEKFFTAILTLSGAAFGGWPLLEDDGPQDGPSYWDQE